MRISADRFLVFEKRGKGIVLAGAEVSGGEGAGTGLGADTAGAIAFFEGPGGMMEGNREAGRAEGLDALDAGAGAGRSAECGVRRRRGRSRECGLWIRRIGRMGRRGIGRGGAQGLGEVGFGAVEIGVEVIEGKGWADRDGTDCKRGVRRGEGGEIVGCGGGCCW